MKIFSGFLVFTFYSVVLRGRFVDDVTMYKFGWYMTTSCGLYLKFVLNFSLENMSAANAVVLIRFAVNGSGVSCWNYDVSLQSFASSRIEP